MGKEKVAMCLLDEVGCEALQKKKNRILGAASSPRKPGSREQRPGIHRGSHWGTARQWVIPINSYYASSPF
jgi:hypothetical protein